MNLLKKIPLIIMLDIYFSDLDKDKIGCRESENIKLSAFKGGDIDYINDGDLILRQSILIGYINEKIKSQTATSIGCLLEDDDVNLSKFLKKEAIDSIKQISLNDFKQFLTGLKNNYDINFDSFFYLPPVVIKEDIKEIKKSELIPMISFRILNNPNIDLVVAEKILEWFRDKVRARLCLIKDRNLKVIDENIFFPPQFFRLNEKSNDDFNLTIKSNFESFLISKELNDSYTKKNKIKL